MDNSELLEKHQALVDKYRSNVLYLVELLRKSQENLGAANRSIDEMESQAKEHLTQIATANDQAATHAKQL